MLFVLIFGIVRFLEGHRFGYYLRAVREGQETAESLGVNSTAVKLTAMALSAALAGLCGAFFVQYNLRVDPGMVMSLDMSMKFVLVAILGGAGTLVGPLLGAAVLIPLQEYTRALWGGLGGGVDLIVFGVLIIVIVVKQPAGISGIVRDIARRFGRRPATAKEGLPLALLEVRDVTKKFGELVANDRVSFTVEAGAISLDRAQRRRQDHPVQLHLRPVPGYCRPDIFRRRRDHGASILPDRPHGRGAHLPGGAAAQGHDGFR